MTEPTPDQHIKTLDELAALLEKTKRNGSAINDFHVRWAAAIRWILNETAYGCDAKELPQ